MKYVFKKWSLLAATAVLAACGGGGGSGGTGIDGSNTMPTEIFLSAEKSSLPLNITHLQPGAPWGYSGTGRESPYTTALTVEAKVDGRYIPSSGDTEVFSCTLDGAGIEIGALYYLDGDEDHEVEVTLTDGSTVKVPGAYRSIALPSFGGSATFHFHGTNGTAGVATVTCSYTDPRDNQVRSASTQIRIGAENGGGDTGSTDYIESTSTGQFGYLHTQGSQLNTQLLLNVRVWNDLDQPVPNPPSGVNNLYARIVSSYSDASRVAQLRGAGATVAGSGTTMAVPTINGLATFSVTSGQYEGPILIEFMTDRADNNVSNGIVQPVSNLMVVYAMHEPPPSTVPALTITADQTLEATRGQPFMGVLKLDSPGLPPHVWSLIGEDVLGAYGLTLNSNGVISGTPTRTVENLSFMVSVTDSTNRYVPWRSNQIATGSATLTIKESTFSPHIAGCEDLTTPCELKTKAVVGQSFTFALTGEGGDGVYTWKYQPATTTDPTVVTGIHGFLSFDEAAGIISAQNVPQGSVACVPDTATPPTYTLTEQSYDFVVSVTSGGITNNQTVRLWVTMNCP